MSQIYAKWLMTRHMETSNWEFIYGDRRQAWDEKLNMWSGIKTFGATYDLWCFVDHVLQTI